MLLDVDPKIAMERIQKRGGEVHAHENPVDLERLREEFHRIAGVAKEDGLDVIKIDTGKKSADNVSEEIARMVEAKMSGQREGSG